MSETTLVPKAVDLEKPIASAPTVETLFAQYRRSFEVAAPQHLDINRVMQVALMTVSRNPYLLGCTSASLLGAFMLSVQLGLDIGAKECHLVPFRNKKNGQLEIQLVPDYRGVLKLARNSREICGMRARCVYKQDQFAIEEGSTPRLVHVPSQDHKRLFEDIIGAYSIADFCNPDTRMPTGYTDAHYLPRVHIDKVRAKSPASDKGPWVDHYDEMAMKTVIKHHSKTLPYSIEMSTAIELDNRVEMVRPQNIELMPGAEPGLLTAAVPPEPQDNVPDGFTQGTSQPAPAPSGLVISESQAGRAFAIGKKSGFTVEQYRAVVKKHGFDSDREITKAKYEQIVAELQKGPVNAA